MWWEWLKWFFYAKQTLSFLTEWIHGHKFWGKDWDVAQAGHGGTEQCKSWSESITLCPLYTVWTHSITVLTLNYWYDCFCHIFQSNVSILPCFVGALQVHGLDEATWDSVKVENIDIADRSAVDPKVRCRGKPIITLLFSKSLTGGYSVRHSSFWRNWRCWQLSPTGWDSVLINCTLTCSDCVSDYLKS